MSTSLSLPVSPSLEQLRKQAKELRRAFQAAETEAVQRVQARFPDRQSPELSLAEAQFVLAREYDFPSWPKLKQYVERISGAPQLQRVFETDIQYFEGRAEGLMRTLQDALPSSLRQVRQFHPAFANASDEEIRRAALSLDDARLILAREHGFNSWRALQNHVRDLTSGKTTEPFLTAFHALKSGDMVAFAAVLKRDPSLPNALGTNGNNLLGLAGSFRRPEATRMLIAAGADVNLGNRYGWTALHQAAYSNLPEFADMLLAAGASTQICARGEGGTPLMQALFWGHAAMADKLAAHGISHLNLRVAAGLGRLDLLESFFEGDGRLKPEAGAYREYYRPHGGFPNWTAREDRQEILDEAFVYAAKNGRVPALEFLLARGAQIDGEPYNGRALHWAVSSGQRAVVDWLLDHGADLEGKCRFGGVIGVTPLHIAAWGGKADMARLLVERGADVNARDDQYFATPLGWADFNGQTKARDFLLQHGGQNLGDAIRFGLLDRVRELLEQDPEIVNRPLFEAPAEPDAYAEPPLPLYRAILAGGADLVRLLVEGGAVVREPYKEGGLTPLEYAVEKKQEEIATILRNFL